jgi:hypothetical protein
MGVTPLTAGVVDLIPFILVADVEWSIAFYETPASTSSSATRAQRPTRVRRT